MTTHTLSSGTIIKDNRDIGCGIQIENPKLFYMGLCYTKRDGFYMSVLGRNLKINEITSFQIELNEMLKNLEECEKIFNPNKK